jgi:hypothetical protein
MIKPVLPATKPQLTQLAYGRRIVNLCMFFWLATGAFNISKTPIFGLFFLGVTVATIVGTRRVAQGLAKGGISRSLLVAGSCIPILGLLVMGWLSDRAAAVLRSSGYQVGMFLSVKP